MLQLAKYSDEQVVIEDGIPIPDAKSRITNKYKLALMRMTKGQSFLAPLKTRQGMRHFGSTVGAKVRIEAVDETQIRVWRVN